MQVFIMVKCKFLIIKIVPLSIDFPSLVNSDSLSSLYISQPISSPREIVPDCRRLVKGWTLRVLKKGAHNCSYIIQHDKF